MLQNMYTYSTVYFIFIEIQPNSTNIKDAPRMSGFCNINCVFTQLLCLAVPLYIHMNKDRLQFNYSNQLSSLAMRFTINNYHKK